MFFSKNHIYTSSQIPICMFYITPKQKTFNYLVKILEWLANLFSKEMR